MTAVPLVAGPLIEYPLVDGPLAAAPPPLVASSLQVADWQLVPLAIE